MHRTMETTCRCVGALRRHRSVRIALPRLGGPWRSLLVMATLLVLTACNSPHPPPQGTALQDVRAVEIRYSYSGWERAEEVHRLRPGCTQASALEKASAFSSRLFSAWRSR